MIPCDECITKAICLNLSILRCSILYEWIKGSDEFEKQDHNDIYTRSYNKCFFIYTTHEKEGVVIFNNKLELTSLRDSYYVTLPK